MLPEPISLLAEKFRLFPGIGYRGSLKMALDTLSMSDEDFESLSKAFLHIRGNVYFCAQCGFFCEASDHSKLCNICKNRQRNIRQICLVEKPTDVINVEKSAIYSGIYHVLGNLISPLDNIFPHQTSVHELIERLSKIEGDIELILFFKAGFGAEATTAYLTESLEQNNLTKRIQVTRLAQGLPLYYNPDTLDQATMAKALEDRREI
jgi:recombination protein RecR